MASVQEFERERSELGTVLKSGIFNRAPNLALVLRYVCSQYFEHGAQQIKEYNIAVEGLGRPPEFDPRADSIVRVEAHLLRKRLKEYYEADGACHGIQIEIPAGQYAPRFLYLEPANPADDVVAPLVVPEAIPHKPARAALWPPRPNKLWIAACVFVLLGTILPIIYIRSGYSRSLTTPKVAAVAATEAIRIACGLEHGTYIDA